MRWRSFVGRIRFAILSDEVFADVLDYLAGGGASLRRQYTEVFGKLELDDEGFATKPGRVQRDFLQNVGTIPSIGSVRIHTKTRALGSVDEGFIRQLRLGDVFIIAGRPVRLEKVAQMEAWVTRADGETPTVPRWNANKMPLSNRVAEEIGAFRGELRNAIADCGLAIADCEVALRAWIAKRLDCGKGERGDHPQDAPRAARDLRNPTDEYVLVEEFVEMNKGRPRARHYFFTRSSAALRMTRSPESLPIGSDGLRGGNAIATPHDYGFRALR
jgi:ATP-dependent Lhr-like helicase